MALGRLPIQALQSTGATAGLLYPSGGMSYGSGMGLYGPQMASAASIYPNAGMGAFSPAYEQAMSGLNKRQQSNPMLDSMFKEAASNWIDIPGLDFMGMGSMTGAGTSAATGAATGAASTAAGGVTGAAGAGTGAAASGASTAAGGLAAAAPAMMWALPFIAGAGILSADAAQRGATTEDLAKWWAGPIGNAIEGDWEEAGKGAMRMAGPTSIISDVIDERPWEETAAGALGGPIGYVLHDIIAGKPSEDWIKRFSGFGKKK